MKHFIRTYIPTLVSAVLLAWSFPSYHFYFLAWIALVPLLLRTASLKPAQAALHFYICGHLFHTLTLQWLIANIFWAGGWAIIGQQGLCIILSLFWALTGFLWSLAHSRSQRLGGALCFAGLWAGMELFQSMAFTGFGWCALGYTQGANLFIAQWAALGGVMLLSFLIVWVNACLALSIGSAEFRIRRLVTVAVLALCIPAVGYYLLGEADDSSTPLRACVVQPNFSQEMKWDPAYDYEMLQRTAQMTRIFTANYPVDLIVWPEALVIRNFENPLFLDTLALTAKDCQAAILSGVVREDYSSGKNYNTAALIKPDGKIGGYYDKVRLAAFGEYIPFEKYLPFLKDIAFGGVDAGEKQLLLPVDKRQLGPLICFEVLFAPMAEELRRMGADTLVVMTNLAWFGRSNAIVQELEIARMRAIETRLPLIHSTNTGISGVFDPYGRFSVVRHTISSSNVVQDWGDATKPHHVMMRRYIGSFSVPAPALQPIPRGAAIVPWLLPLVGLLLFFFTFFETPLSQALSGAYALPEEVPPKKATAKTKAKAAPKKSAASKKSASANSGVKSPAKPRQRKTKAADTDPDSE